VQPLSHAVKSHVNPAERDAGTEWYFSKPFNIRGDSMPEHETNPAFGEMVHRYTIKEAEEDGILINILEIWEKSLISHVTSNLLSKGYLENRGSQSGGNQELNMPNLINLLNQAIEQIKKQSPDGRVRDFYSFRVELPDGSRQLLFAQMNELGRLTLMLPEDY